MIVPQIVVVFNDNSNSPQKYVWSFWAIFYVLWNNDVEILVQMVGSIQTV